MDPSSWSVGDWLIYRKSKRSNSPGHRAQNVSPASRGESYGYTVEKYWIVTEVCDDGSLMVETMRGKRHKLEIEDPAIRKPRLWERWLLRRRFHMVENSLKE